MFRLLTGPVLLLAGAAGVWAARDPAVAAALRCWGSENSCASTKPEPSISMRVVRLQRANAEMREPQLSRIVATVLSRRRRTSTPSGRPDKEIFQCIADSRTNSLILVADAKRMPEILYLVKQLDVP